jgi:hypothetical protein
MADVPDIPRPSQLWKQLTPERKQAAAEAFWADESASMVADRGGPHDSRSASSFA